MLKVQNIIDKLGCIEFIGNGDAEILSIKSALDDVIDKTTITWIGEKYYSLFAKITEGTVVCPASAKSEIKHKNCNYIFVDSPKNYFSKVILTFFVDTEKKGVSKTSVIDKTATIGNNVFIGDHVVIEKNCFIGNHVVIDHNTVLKANTKIHDHVKIGCNCTIGAWGFGYSKNEEGNYEALPHIGGVELSRFVEVGNNTCIDKGALGDTFIGEHTKIDNLVHIAHNVKIGKNCIIIANSLIGGSTIIEDEVWVAPSATLLNKLKAFKGSTIGSGAVLVKDAQQKKIYMGNPAEEKELFLALRRAFKKLLN